MKSEIQFLVSIVLLAVASAGLFVQNRENSVYTGEETNESFTVHGRLRCYNGNPSLRIWIVGSNRILGVRETEDTERPGIPERLHAIFDDGEGWFAKEMFGDFTVEPLAKDIPGHMRPVRVISVRNLVVTLDGEVIIDERNTEQVAAGNGH